MTDVDRLLADYIAEHRAGGEADPRDYLARASPAQRTELAALIDAYLARAPRQSFDEAAFRGSGAERTVDELERAIAGQAGLWPALLPQLRDRAGLKRSELVDRLAAALGVSDRKAKVAAYYHEMEQGLLPAQGVSDRVLGALGQLVGETAQTLREAGYALTPPSEGRAAAPAAFARRASRRACRSAVGRRRRRPKKPSGTRSTSCSAPPDVRFRPTQTTLSMIDDARRPRPSGARAPRRAGGRLAARRADRANARRPGRAPPFVGARRAYATLVVKLGLSGRPAELRSRLMEEIERAAEDFLARHPKLCVGRRHPPGPDRGDR